MTNETPETSSLIDVDTPSVRTVPSDYAEQEIQTETQAERIEREEEARRDAEAAHHRGGGRKKPHYSWLTRQLTHLSDRTANALAVGNMAAVVGLSSYMGYKAWGLYERGRLSWQSIGLGLGILGVVGLGEGVFAG